MHRTPSEGTKVPPPLRVLPALLLLLLFVTAPLLHCSATVSNSSSVATRTGAVPAASNRATSRIIGCYPGVIFYGSGTEYRCQVDNVGSLSGQSLCTLHRNANPQSCVWNASLAGNFVVFRADGTWENTGDFPLSIGTFSVFFSKRLTESLSIPFMRSGESDFLPTVPNPYYGMSMSVRANLPSGQTVSRHVLFSPTSDAPVMMSQCTVRNQCYDVTNMRLPPPGSYRLRVAGRDWNDYLLPWGTRSVRVSALVATPLTLTNGVVPYVRLYNGDTSAVVSFENVRMYLARCAFATCPSITPVRGEIMIDAAVCDQAVSNVVELSRGVLDAPAGTYALCVAFDSNPSPTALPVTVLEDPFSIKVDNIWRDSVTLQVGGGDLATRTEPYEVCIAENSSSCDTVTSGSKCTRSASPNAQTVDVDVRDVPLKNKATFCLVTRRVTYNDHIYVDVQAEANYVAVGVGSEGMSIWLLILIVLGCVLAVCLVILVVCCCRRRMASAEEESFADKEWGSGSSMSLSSRSFTGSMRSGRQGSMRSGRQGSMRSARQGSMRSARQGSFCGDQMHSGCIPSVHSSSHSLRAQSQGGMEQDTQYGNWM